MPARELDLGPLSLPSPPLTKLTFSLPTTWTPRASGASTSSRASWSLRPGLVGAVRARGRGWSPRSLRPRRAWSGCWGVVALVSAVAFVFTPQGLGTEADPMFFKFNLRYPTPALVLGLALLPLAAPARWRRLQAVLGWGVRLVLLVHPARSRRSGPPTCATAASPAPPATHAQARRRDRRCGAAGRAAFARPRAGAARGRRGAGRRAGFRPVARRRPARLPERPLRGLRADAETSRAGPADTEDARIAIAGFFIQYPLYGARPVEPRGLRGASRTARRLHAVRRCREWREALNDGGYRYVVTTPFNYPGNLRRRSAAGGALDCSDPAARLVLRDAA